MVGQLVTVQVGQCGNQLGLDFFTALAREGGREEEDSAALTHCRPLHEHLPALFRESKSPLRSTCPSTARAVLLDAEPRVIANVVNSVAQSASLSQQWQYTDTDEALKRVWKKVGASGSANNWAFGYYRHGEALGEVALESVRREAEHCDRLSGFLFFQSLAGGTGSGAGARVAEMLRDEHPCCFMFHTAVWPGRRSEVVVQSYNAVLSLSHLLDTTDALLALHNEDAHDICTRRLQIARPSFEHLNAVLAASVAELWLPSSSSSSSSSSTLHHRTPEIGDVVGTACASPLHKLLSLRSLPHIAPEARAFSSTGWAGTVRNLRQMALTSWHSDEGLDWSVLPTAQTAALDGVRRADKALAHLLYLRGPDWRSADVSLFRDPALYPSWVPSLPLSVVGSERESGGEERRAVLLSNSQGAAPHLHRILHRASALRSVDAYLHQYRKFGLCNDHLDLSLASLEQVASDYENL